MSPTEYRRRAAEEEKAEKKAREQLPSILKKYSWPLEEIRRDSSFNLNELSLHEQRRHFLCEMFNVDDVVWCGMKWESGKNETLGIHYGHKFKTVEEWLRLPIIRGEFTSHCTFVPGTISRCKDSVVDRAYMVVESDILIFDQIGSIFRYLREERNLKLKAIVTTGGKSVHGWFDWPHHCRCVELAILEK
jgi:hypothetical protein